MNSRRDFLTQSAALVSGATLPLVGCSSAEVEAPAQQTVFLHGVASGDPLTDSVMIWTRISGATVATEVSWEVSLSPDGSSPAAQGKVTADSARDYTVKVDAKGLAAGKTYYYRFRALGVESPVGRTKTLPVGALDRLRLGVVSCSSLGHGYFHGYRDLAGRSDLDAVLHLGDYIYEYATNQYGEVRPYEPPTVIVSLTDYRTRYAQYRKDADLQALHAMHPMIAIWDDHETADNAWATGAPDHDEKTLGAFTARKVAATRAYDEWMPTRLGAVYRKVSFGDLLDLFLLDTRMLARPKQVTGKSDPALRDVGRSLLGPEQERFLFEGIESSKAAWRVIGQQVMMAQLPQFFNSDAWDGYPLSRERLFAHLKDKSIQDILVLTGDIHSSWVMDLVPDPKDPAYDPTTGKGSLGVEFVCPAISSPGFPPELGKLSEGLMKDNRHIRYAELVSRGFIVLDVTKSRVQAAWFHYTEVEEKVATAKFSTAFSVKKGSALATKESIPA